MMLLMRFTDSEETQAPKVFWITVHVTVNTNQKKYVLIIVKEKG